jgi:hypothetical protein
MRTFRIAFTAITGAGVGFSATCLVLGLGSPTLQATCLIINILVSGYWLAAK